MFRALMGTALAMVLTSGSASAAPVTIDDFNSTSYQVIGAPGMTSGANPNAGGGLAAGAIGGHRRFVATRTAPAGTTNVNGRQVQITITGGQASVSLGAGTDGFAEFIWGHQGPLASDLTDGSSNDQVLIRVLQSDQLGVSYTLHLDGVPVTKTTSGPGEQVLSFGLDEFGAEDGTDVDRISLLIEGPSSFDTVFEFIGAVPSVPLPAAGLFVLAGLGALGATRKRG